MTNKQTNPSPLWRELNQKRKQGNWQMSQDKCDVETADDARLGIFRMFATETSEADAQYTALSVNNLASLAEALEAAQKELRLLNVTEDGGQKGNTPASLVISQIETALLAIS